MDRQQILENALAYSEVEAGAAGKYAFAFGMVSSLLRDEDLKRLQEIVVSLSAKVGK